MAAEERPVAATGGHVAMARSVAPLSISRSPSSRNRVSASGWFSACGSVRAAGLFGKTSDNATDACDSASRSDYPVGSLTHSASRRDGAIVSETEYTSIDALGRVTASQQTTAGLAAKSFAYTYASDGSLQQVQYPSGQLVSYDADGANQVKAVRKGATGTNLYLKDAQYKPHGALASGTVGLDAAHQWTETRDYNSRLQTKKLTIQAGTQKLLGLNWVYTSSYDSSYEDQGTDNYGDVRKEGLELANGSSILRSYTYDGAHRVTSYEEPGKGQSYGYDAFGNLWQVRAATGVPALRATGSSWYVGADGLVRNRLNETEYDAAGNQTQLSAAAGTTASYDGEGRLVEVKAGASVIGQYEYDGEGRRVKRTANGSVTHYVYDAEGQLMAEYGAVGGEVGTRYVVADYLGTTRMLLDEQGVCKGQMDYAPYGAQVPRSGAGVECYGTAPQSGLAMFTGQVRDGESAAGTESGLDYMGARMYWASLGRFTSVDPENAGADPLVPGSWNMYSYALNNPLAYLDQGGLGPCPVDTETGEEKPCIEGLLYEAWYRTVLETMLRGQQTAEAVQNEISQFRNNPNCAAALTIGGGAVGAGIGWSAGGSAGGAAGFTAGSIVPVAGNAAGAAAGFSFGSGVGAFFGGGVGTTAGRIAGAIICSSGTGSGGTSGGGGGGSSSLSPRERASKIGGELVKKFKQEGVGQAAGRSGGHGTPFARAGAELIRMANKLNKNDPLRDALKTEGNRLLNHARGISH